MKSRVRVLSIPPLATWPRKNHKTMPTEIKKLQRQQKLGRGRVRANKQPNFRNYESSVRLIQD